MRFLSPLLESVKHRVRPPVAIALGSPRPVAKLAATLGVETTCFQMDLYQAQKLRDTLKEDGTPSATVAASADLWDLPATFNTVIVPAAAQTDRELKIDMIDQAWHILQPGGLCITLSEYKGDTTIARLHKKLYGKCGETPSSDAGMAFFSAKQDEPRDRRRHEVSFHAKFGDGPAMTFLSRPGLFSYGRFDNGSRALLEVAQLQPGERVLDLGCGVGAVGCLASAVTKGRTTFIDSHLRAIALTEMNIAANAIPNATVIASENMDGMETGIFDAILANPPYYGDSMVARLFIGKSRDLLKPRGRFYIVTKMPTAVVPLTFETFGSCDVIENRGYAVVTATSL